MRKQTWTYLFVAAGMLAGWSASGYMQVQPLKEDLKAQVKKVAEFDKCKNEKEKLEKAVSARRSARSDAKDDYVWKITSVDYFARSNTRGDKNVQPDMKLVISVPESLKDIEGALIHLSRVDKKEYPYTRSVPISAIGLEVWNKFILNNNGKARIRLEYFDPTLYYSQEPDVKGDYLRPIIVK